MSGPRLTTLGVLLLSCVALLVSVPAAAQRQAQPGQRAGAPEPTTRVTTTDGSVLNGAITGGAVTVRTSFGGDLRVEARRIQSLAGMALTLDDGSVVQGSLGGGQIQLASPYGALTIPGERVREIQSLKAPPVASAPRPDVREAIVGTWDEEREALEFRPDGTGLLSHRGLGLKDAAMKYGFTDDGRLRIEMELYGNRVVRLHRVDMAGDRESMVLRSESGSTRFARVRTPERKAAPPKPAEASVQFVNETRRTLNLCIGGETPCAQLGPRESLARTLPVGRHHIKVESTTMLGPLVIGTGSFERAIDVEPDAVIRLTDNDFR